MKPVQPINNKSDQISMDFNSWANIAELSFQNAEKCEIKNESLHKEDLKAKGIEQLLLRELFKKNPNRDFTPYEVLEFLKLKNIKCKEASVRSRLSGLCKLLKHQHNGINMVSVVGKRVNIEYSHLANNCYQLTKI